MPLQILGVRVPVGTMVGAKELKPPFSPCLLFANSAGVGRCTRKSILLRVSKMFGFKTLKSVGRLLEARASGGKTGHTACDCNLFLN